MYEGCGVGMDALAIAHLRPGDEAPLEHDLGPRPEHGRTPQHQIRQLADFHRPDLVRHAMGDGRVDRVLGDVAADAQVVVLAASSPASRPRCSFILCAVCQVRVITSPTRPMAWLSLEMMQMAPEVVQDILGGDGLAADAALGEGDVLGDVLVEVVTHHEHVEVLVEGVHRQRSRGVGAAGDDVGLAAHAEDVGGVAAAGALGVVGVDGAPAERRDGVVDVAGFVQGVGVDGDLHVLFARRRRGSNRWSPGVVPQSSCSLRPTAPARICSSRPSGCEVLPLPVRPMLSGSASVACSMQRDVPGAGGAGGGVGAGGGSGSAAEEGGHPAGDGLEGLLRADEMDVRVDAARRDHQPLGGDGLGRHAHHHPRRDARLMAAGLPALPMPVILPCLMPMSAL